MVRGTVKEPKRKMEINLESNKRKRKTKREGKFGSW